MASARLKLRPRLPEARIPLTLPPRSRRHRSPCWERVTKPRPILISVEALYQCVAPTIAQGEQALSPRSAPGLLLHGIEAEGVLAVPWCQHIFYLFVRNNWLSHGKPKRVIALLVQHRP